MRGPEQASEQLCLWTLYTALYRHSLWIAFWPNIFFLSEIKMSEFHFSDILSIILIAIDIGVRFIFRNEIHLVKLATSGRLNATTLYLHTWFISITSILWLVWSVFSCLQRNITMWFPVFLLSWLFSSSVDVMGWCKMTSDCSKLYSFEALFRYCSSLLPDSSYDGLISYCSYCGLEVKVGILSTKWHRTVLFSVWKTQMVLLCWWDRTQQLTAFEPVRLKPK